MMVAIFVVIALVVVLVDDNDLLLHPAFDMNIPLLSQRIP